MFGYIFRIRIFYNYFILHNLKWGVTVGGAWIKTEKKIVDCPGGIYFSYVFAYTAFGVFANN